MVNTTKQKGKMKLPLTIEHAQNGMLWGRVFGFGNYIVSGKGETMEALLENIKQTMQRHKRKAGEQDHLWNNLDIDAIEFELIRK